MRLTLLQNWPLEGHFVHKFNVCDSCGLDNDYYQKVHEFVLVTLHGSWPVKDVCMACLLCQYLCHVVLCILSEEGVQINTPRTQRLRGHFSVGIYLAANLTGFI